MRRANENFHFNFESKEKTIILTLKRRQSRMNNDSEVSSLGIFFKNKNRKNLRKTRKGWKQCKLKKRPRIMLNSLKKCTGQKFLKLKSKKSTQSDNHYKQNTLEKTQSN